MTDFKTTLLELAEPSDKTYASEDLKALESKSNFVLKSDAVEDLGGPEGSAVFLEYSASSNQPSFAGMLCEDASSNSLGLFLHFTVQNLTMNFLSGSAEFSFHASSSRRHGQRCR